MKYIGVRVGWTLLAVAAATTPMPSFAACEGSAPSDEISREGQRMIWEGELRKVEANAAIDRETAQRLLSRLFDLETGKAKNLPPELEAQFRRDAEYFSAKLRKEADEERAAAEAVLERVAQCSADQPGGGK